MLKDNLYYLNLNYNNKEPIYDEAYAVIKGDKNIDLYIEQTKTIQEYLATIKTLKNNNDTNIEKYYKLLIQILIFKL